LGEPVVSLRVNRKRGLPEKRDLALSGDFLAAQRAERDGTHKTKEGVSKVSQGEVTNGALREGQLEVLAEHSTDSLLGSRLGRWGTEVQGTHCREGEAGQNRSWRERWARP